MGMECCLDILIFKHLEDKVFIFILLMGKYCFMDDSNLCLNLRQERFFIQLQSASYVSDIVNHLGLAIKYNCGIWKLVLVAS